MSMWRPHGRASISSRHPRAVAICDRCGFMFNRDKLRYQPEVAGAGVVIKRILVCSPCWDRPQKQLSAPILPADPVPARNPRPERVDMGPEPVVQSVREILEP